VVSKAVGVTTGDCTWRGGDLGPGCRYFKVKNLDLFKGNNKRLG